MVLSDVKIAQGQTLVHAAYTPPERMPAHSPRCGPKSRFLRTTDCSMTEPISGRAAHDLPRTPPSVTLESNAVTISCVSPSILKVQAGPSNSSSRWANFDFSMLWCDPSVTEARGAQSATSPTSWRNAPDATPCFRSRAKFGRMRGSGGVLGCVCAEPQQSVVVAMSQGSQLRVGTAQPNAANAMHNGHAFMERRASDASSEAPPYVDEGAAQRPRKNVGFVAIGLVVQVNVPQQDAHVLHSRLDF